MEVDKRLFKQMLDQLGYLTEQDVDRRIEQINVLFDEISDIKRETFIDDHRVSCKLAGYKYTASKGHALIAKKLLSIKEHVRTIYREIKNVELYPKYDEKIKDIEKIYFSLAFKCRTVLGFEDEYVRKL